MDITTSTTLNNGIEMPLIGLGTFQSAEGDEVEQAVRWAIEAGYRSIDTASLYGNEVGVGRGIAASGVSRDDIFVTTKVWNTDQGYTGTHAAFERSLAKLGTDYLDLYLVHWPRPLMMHETWRAMEEIYSMGAVRAIGVSNFMPHHLDQLLGHASIPPAVNQIEHHPGLQQPDVLAASTARDVTITAWAPLMKGHVNDIPALIAIADAVGATPAQVTLRWMVQRGVVAIPKSVRRERIIGNIDVFGFELTDEHMATIAGLDADDRMGPHPDIFPGS